MIVWLVPSFITAAISVSLIGLYLGPMYPVAINHVGRVLPRHLVNRTVGWMSACGAGRSALLPFLIGTKASKLGIESLQPLCVFQGVPSISRDSLTISFLGQPFSDDDYFGYGLGFCAKETQDYMLKKTSIDEIRTRFWINNIYPPPTKAFSMDFFFVRSFLQLEF